MISLAASSSTPAWPSTRSTTSLAFLTALIVTTSASPVPAPRRGGKVRVGSGSDDIASPVFYLSYESGTVFTSSGKTISGIWVPDAQTSATTPCTFWSDGEPLDYHRRSCKAPTLQWWLWAAIALLGVFVLYSCCFGRTKDDGKEEQEAEAQEGGDERQVRQEQQQVPAEGGQVEVVHAKPVQ
ncbi:hypothetical protein BCR44DRAFT_65187 [Catenaria anguillulae PL171]|uniref:Uncharacterized protein n=1 Tax=Catenaria anguillulae PL171 TaxID=765915 RepID=A0A1Y2I3G0_9FUNG|nr:hypothetical protein BCR44DRAFT_65187 [Catenaria anguillulae PL171]